MKKTYRKGFNFFRSYFDVCNELPDKARLEFLDALLKKQFLGEEPTSLTGMAKFAWISQIHSIDSQVKGYETKTNTKLSDPSQAPTVAPTLPPSVQVQEKGEVQGEGEEKEKVKEKKPKKVDFIPHWNDDKIDKNGFRIEEK